MCEPENEQNTSTVSQVRCADVLHHAFYKQKFYKYRWLKRTQKGKRKGSTRSQNFETELKSHYSFCKCNILYFEFKRPEGGEDYKKHKTLLVYFLSPTVSVRILILSPSCNASFKILFLQILHFNCCYLLKYRPNAWCDGSSHFSTFPGESHSKQHYVTIIKQLADPATPATIALINPPWPSKGHHRWCTDG